MTASRLRVAEVMECTIGGTRRHIGELTTGLAAAGIEVTLFASAVRDPTFRDDLGRIATSGVRVFELPMVREIAPATDLRHLLVLAREFRRGRFDVIHTHSSKAGALGRAAARITARGAKLVHTPHTFAFNFAEQFSARKRALFLAIERRLGRVTDRLIHVSASERAEGLALAIVPSERAVVIPNGIDPAPYATGDRMQVRRELGLDSSTPLIGAVGLLNEAKGHTYLIDAMRDLVARGSGAHCVIVGEGALRGELEARIAAAGLGSRVHLLGYRRDVPAVLAAFDVFAMPSLWEGMPYGVLEAMASELPVVASDVNGCRDLVEDGVTGLLVPSRDAGSLAAALGRLLADAPFAGRLAVAGRRRVASEYSLATMIERYAELFRALATEGRSRCASST